MAQHVKLCALCGQRMAGDAKFCAACGWSADEPPPAPRVWQFTKGNNFLVALLVIALVFGIVYRLNNGAGLSGTYGTFIGLPLLIGVLTAYLTRPQTGVGSTIKITTVLLCAVCPLLGEGAICILMAAPIFYSIALIGYFIVAGLIRWIDPNKRGTPLGLTLLPFIVAYMTTGPDGIRNPRTITTSGETFIAASPDKVWQTLQRDDLVTADFPLFLRLGFPLPTKLERYSDGLTRLAFGRNAEDWRTPNAILSRCVMDAENRRMTFLIEKDGTMLSQWLTFLETRFEVIPAEGGCRLRQTTVFRQRLQPGLYFNPLEGFAMKQMHAYALASIKRLAETAPAAPAPSPRTVARMPLAGEEKTQTLFSPLSANHPSLTLPLGRGGQGGVGEGAGGEVKR